MRTKTHATQTGSADCRITARRFATCHEVNTSRIVQAVRAALGNRPCRSLAVVIVDDARIAQLHRQFMADPTPTDVLTFDLRDDLINGPIEGEVVVSVETARRQARRYRTEPDQELLRYAIHGTLHLVGFDDRTPSERRRMRREEDRILVQLAGKGPGTEKRMRPRRARPMHPQETFGRA